eukprot:15004802-Alexandrium_andersonii.AAC.1
MAEIQQLQDQVAQLVQALQEQRAQNQQMGQQIAGLMQQQAANQPVGMANGAGQADAAAVVQAVELNGRRSDMRNLNKP